MAWNADLIDTSFTTLLFMINAKKFKKKIISGSCSVMPLMNLTLQHVICIWNKWTSGIIRKLRKFRRLLLVGVMGGWVQLGPVSTAATNRPIVPARMIIMMRNWWNDWIGRGNQSTRRKPAPMPLCLPQTPRSARTRTWAATVGSQRLTASATALPQRRHL
jgi:hypothetical protein